MSQHRRFERQTECQSKISTNWGWIKRSIRLQDVIDPLIEQGVVSLDQWMTWKSQKEEDRKEEFLHRLSQMEDHKLDIFSDILRMQNHINLADCLESKTHKEARRKLENTNTKGQEIKKSTDPQKEEPCCDSVKECVMGNTVHLQQSVSGATSMNEDQPMQDTNMVKLLELMTAMKKDQDKQEKLLSEMEINRKKSHDHQTNILFEMKKGQDHDRAQLIQMGFKIDSIEKSKNDLREEITRLRQETKEAMQEKEEIETRNKQLVAEISERNKEVTELESKITELEKYKAEVGNQKNLIEKLEVQYRELLVKKDVIENVCTGLESKMKSFEKKYLTIMEKQVKFEQIPSHLEKCMATAKEEKKNLQESLKSLNEDLEKSKKIEEEFVKLKADRDRLEKDKERMENNLKNVKQEKNALKMSLEMVQTKLNRLQKGHITGLFYPVAK